MFGESFLGQRGDALIDIGMLSIVAVGLSPLLLAGFSFGSAVALRGHVAAGAASLLLVAPPAGMGYLDQATAPQLPWQVIHGSRDELIDLNTVRGWLASVATAPPLTVLDDADHFFHGRLTPLREAITAFWRPLFGPAP